MARVLEVRRTRIVKASLSLGKWNAQWMQNPTSEEGSLREWWRGREKIIFQNLQHVIQSYDTAFLKKGKKRQLTILLLLRGGEFFMKMMTDR